MSGPVWRDVQFGDCPAVAVDVSKIAAVGWRVDWSDYPYMGVDGELVGAGAGQVFAVTVEGAEVTLWADDGYRPDAVERAREAWREIRAQVVDGKVSRRA